MRRLHGFILMIIWLPIIANTLESYRNNPLPVEEAGGLRSIGLYLIKFGTKSRLFRTNFTISLGEFSDGTS